MPKFSIVIPVYNSETYLEECVSSVLAQAFEDFEVLLIDDGSTDGSGTICDELQARDARIRVFHQENGGAAKARNRGIDLAEGKYLMFVDGDDTVSSDCLETVEPLLSDDHSLPVFGMLFEYWNDERIVRTEECSIGLPGSYSVKEIAGALESFFEDNTLSSACNKVFPARLLKDNGLRFPESMTLYEDLAFVLKCLPHFERMVVLPKSLYHYRNKLATKHLDKRVEDLVKLRTNLAALNNTLYDFGSITGEPKGSMNVLANLYVILLEQHLISHGKSAAAMRKEIPEYLSEKSFRSALGDGAELNESRRKLIDWADRGQFFRIWAEFAKRRTKRSIRGTAKRLLRR